MKTAVFYENIADGAKAAGRSTGDALAGLRSAGMDMIYISCDSWERDRDWLSRTLEALDLPIEGMHVFCDFPGGTGEARCRKMIDLAAEAGAGNLLIVPGMLSTGNTKRDLESMVSGMRGAVEYGRSKGLPVLMEDYDGILAPYNCIAGLEYFFQNVPGLECAFDTGNFVMFREDETEAFDLFADRIRTLHLKDRSPKKRHEGDQPFFCADGKPVYACATGSGTVQIGRILQKLRERNYQGNAVIELYCCDARYVLQDAEESLRWVKAQQSSEA